MRESEILLTKLVNITETKITDPDEKVTARARLVIFANAMDERYRDASMSPDWGASNFLFDAYRRNNLDIPRYLLIDKEFTNCKFAVFTDNRVAKVVEGVEKLLSIIDLDVAA